MSDVTPNAVIASLRFAERNLSVSTGRRLAEAYSSGEVRGWNPELSRERFRTIASSGYVPLNAFGEPLYRSTIGLDGRAYAGKKTMLWKFTRKLLGGEDTPNYPQEIGDCAVAGTRVLMCNGETKNIEDVREGEYVVTHKNRTRRVLRTIRKPFTGTLVTVKGESCDETVTMTADHLFLRSPTPFGNARSWKAVADLASGEDFVFRMDGIGFVTDDAERVRVEEVENIEVYCLEVEEDHSFIANGYAVHNCVSFGGKNALEYLQAVDIVLRGENERWKPVFPPYLYHTSRIKVGKGQIPANEDGSLGSWLAEAVGEWGVLFSDDQGVPPYSGQVAKKWGGIRDIEKALYSTARKRLVRSVVLVRTWDDYVAAIVNGYACTTASTVGYENEPRSDGFHRRGPQWAHQMSLVGVGFEPEEYAILLNSWGDAHGRLKDFDDQEPLPVGTLRIRRRDLEAHLEAGETFAWSQFDGFPENADKLDRALFKTVGD